MGKQHTDWTHWSLFIPKNHEFIIDVFNKLSKLDSRYRLVLIGKGPKEQEIKELALEYNIDEKSNF